MADSRRSNKQGTADAKKSGAAEVQPVNGRSSRRDELLAVASGLFAERGLRTTTVRDIADSAGILSGSLYHHFDSKESMVDEILRAFLDSLFETYHQVVAAGMSSRDTLTALIVASFESIDRDHSAVAIYQEEAKRLSAQERFSYIRDRNAEFRGLWSDVLTKGMADGSFRADLDTELVYRFMRDTVWVAVRWYRPGGERTAQQVADQYLSVVLDGIVPR